eukprot:jgi/Mesvir1/6435/Mv19520-RA.1
MSSFKKAIPRREHKERSQPSARKHLGLLEKKKDYILRAKSYHKKEATIKALQAKAAQRNPDEFYFRMQNMQTKDGVNVIRSTEPNKYSQEELILMKSQDVGYVMMKKQVDAKRAERLRATLHGIGEAPCNKRIKFSESVQEAREIASSQAQPAELSPLPEDIDKRRTAAYKELKERESRSKKLQRVAMEMLLKKELMGKGRKRKLRPEELSSAAKQNNRGVYRWKKERKR